MGKGLTIVCVLFRPSRPKSDFPSTFSGWGLYDPPWVDKLNRGFKRNLSIDYSMVCITNFENPTFETEVTAVPFIYEPHVGTWMSITEIFRPDLEIDRGLFCGLDTVICGPMDDIAAYRGPVAMTRDATGVAVVSNAMVLFSGPLMVHLWDLYLADPEGANQRSIAPWSGGLGSEMIFWREDCKHRIDVLDRLYPNRFHDHSCGAGKNPSVVYFRGPSKPSGLKADDPLRKVWETK